MRTNFLVTKLLNISRTLRNRQIDEKRSENIMKHKNCKGKYLYPDTESVKSKNVKRLFHIQNNKQLFRRQTTIYAA